MAAPTAGASAGHLRRLSGNRCGIPQRGGGGPLRRDGPYPGGSPEGRPGAQFLRRLRQDGGGKEAGDAHRRPDLWPSLLRSGHAHVRSESGHVQGHRGGRGLCRQPPGAEKAQCLGDLLRYDRPYRLRTHQPVPGGGQGRPHSGAGVQARRLAADSGEDDL